MLRCPGRLQFCGPKNQPAESAGGLISNSRVYTPNKPEDLASKCQRSNNFAIAVFTKELKSLEAAVPRGSVIACVSTWIAAERPTNKLLEGFDKPHDG